MLSDRFGALEAVAYHSSIELSRCPEIARDESLDTKARSH
jgi:hypothetical protein